MPVFQLPDRIVFPSPEYAEEDGLLAVGGDLSEERLLLAYSAGIFPWYSEGTPILWWSPDPRLILLPDELKVSRSLRQTINKGMYKVTMDKAFGEVIENCASVSRKEGEGTWITAEMVTAYVRLHDSGFAHSVESWYGEELAGGLYGVSLSGVFFGESMFAKRRDASKVAFVKLIQQLKEWDFRLVDCQITTEHLKRLGAREVSRLEFMSRLREALKRPHRHGRWTQTMS
ncbi:MAG TPA: leucyl/phenylalanyl-tRNA--protein transferase [Thermodesulfovibrionales bacterium]|nr:leucyl/phenylalanyl-tRNA--protein transferase [Thermodesulfovibrionales bacterium]